MQSSTEKIVLSHENFYCTVNPDYVLQRHPAFHGIQSSNYTHHDSVYIYIYKIAVVKSRCATFEQYKKKSYNDQTSHHVHSITQLNILSPHKTHRQPSITINRQ